MVGKLKDFSRWAELEEGGFGFRDNAAACGYANASHARMKRIFDLLYPERLPGEEILQTCDGVIRTALLDQLLDAGCDDEMALRSSRDAMQKIGDDLIAGERLGYLVVLRGQHEVLETPRYVASKSTESMAGWFDEDGNLSDGRTCLQIVQIDTSALFTAVANNLKKHLEKFESTGRYSVEEMAQARRDLDSIRATVESAHNTEKAKSAGQEVAKALASFRKEPIQP